MKRLKLFLTVILVIALTLSFTACTRNSKQTGSTSSGKTKGTIAVLNYVSSAPYFICGEKKAKEAGARIVGTGRSDYPNQVNNVLAFPGIFRGAFDVRACCINEEMKLAAAKALANLVSDDELNEDYIIPKPFDKRVAPAVAKAVAQAAVETGTARVKV